MSRAMNRRRTPQKPYRIKVTCRGIRYYAEREQLDAAWDKLGDCYARASVFHAGRWEVLMRKVRKERDPFLARTS